MNIMDFIDQSNSCSSRDQLIKLFETQLLEFGLDKFVYSLARGSFAAKGKTLHGLARSYPESWMKHYVTNNYIEADPTYRYALKHKGPFTWKSLEKKTALTKKEKFVMDEAEDAGIKSGITVAIHGPFGEVVGFGFASNTQQKDMGRNELCTLYALANQFHLVYASFEEESEEQVIKLTDRQKEVLTWTASGKGRAMIAEIMNISEDTVDDHFRHIFRKLECNDRTMAALKAIQMGLIRV